MGNDLISRSALKEWLTRPTGFRANCEDCTDIDCLDCIIGEAIDNAPAVDAVEVIKCRDCFYWMKAKVNRSGFLVCPKSGMEIVATDFCSRAERRKSKTGERP